MPRNFSWIENYKLWLWKNKRKKILIHAHFNVKPVFLSPFQFTNQNKGTFVYAKKNNFQPQLSLDAEHYAIRKIPPFVFVDSSVYIGEIIKNYEANAQLL